MAGTKHRILIVDDHSVLREGLRAIINTTDDLTVCGEAENGQQALQAAQELQPDLAIVDILLKGGMDGIELTRQLRQQLPSMAVLILSMHEEQKYATNALAAGARGYIIKTEDTLHFLTAIRQVLHGGTYMSESIQR